MLQDRKLQKRKLWRELQHDCFNEKHGLCLADDRGKTLDSLAGLGLMHIRTTTLEDSKNRAELQKLHHQVVKTLGIIKSHKLDNTLDRTKDVALADGKTIYEKCTQLIEEQEDCRKKVELLKREVEQLKPWGEFDHQEIDILRQKGIYVYLCVSSDKELVAEKKNPNIRHVSVPQRACLLCFAQ